MALGSHSADVAAWLDCGPHGIVDLCRLSPGTVERRDADRAVPACDAELVIVVDGVSESRPVWFSGVAVGQREAGIK